MCSGMWTQHKTGIHWWSQFLEMCFSAERKSNHHWHNGYITTHQFCVIWAITRNSCRISNSINLLQMSNATQLTRLGDALVTCCTSFHSATSIQVPAKLVCSLRLMNLLTVLRISRLDAPVCTWYEISPLELVSISAQYGATRYSGELVSEKGDGQQEVSFLPNVKYPFVPT